MNYEKYISLVEVALYGYYKINRDIIYQDLQNDEMVPSVDQIYDLKNVFDWNQVYLKSHGQIVFMFEASFDPELGVGVLIVNNKVESIDTQERFI